MPRSDPRIDLTPTKIAKLKPKPDGKAKDYYDDRIRGLVLRVSGEGTCTWRVFWYLPDRRSRFTKIGRYPVMTVEEARDEAYKFLRDPDKGIKERQKLPHLFQEVAEHFIEKHIKEGGLLTGKVIEQRIRKHLIPAFKARGFADVRRAHVNAHLDTIKSKSMRQAVLTIFRSMANHYMLYLDPTESYLNPIVRGFKKYKGKSRERVLSDQEIVVLWKLTEKMGTFGALYQFLLLTGQRREKANRLRHEDVRSGTWHIPVAGTGRPKGHPAEIKLPPLALQIVTSQPKVYKSPFVFPAGRGKGPYNAWGIDTAALQEEMRKELPDMQPFTTHDIRRTARTLLDRLKPAIPFEVKEHAIGHSVGNTVTKTYSRYSFLPEISQAFAQLDAYISQLINPAPSNVVRLKRGRQR